MLARIRVQAATQVGWIDMMNIMTTLRMAALLPLLLTATPLEADNFDLSHSQWSQILDLNVSVDGGTSRVDYQGIQEQPGPLENYLSKLEEVTTEEYSGWSRDQKLAFLINAYNAFTVKLIIDNYPLESIKDLGGWITTPWKKKFFTLLGEPTHLDNIEHDLIRRDFHEPRIHCAVNCASVSCPALRSEAYRVGRLEDQLEEATRAFLRDSRRNRLDLDNRRLELSPIFNWYHRDFEGNGSSILEFVSARITSDSQQQESLREGKIRMTYLDYDWSLNDWNK